MTAVRLAVDNTRTAARERLIRSEYSGGVADRVSRSCSLEGAIRAAIIKVMHRDFASVVIYDGRFGNPNALAVTISRVARGVQITWPRKPKWEHDL